MSKASRAQERARSATPVQPPVPKEPPGTFYNGSRVTTPSGKFMPAARPISHLAARLRGVCLGSREDDDAAMTPLAVSCGSPSRARQQLNSRGRSVSVPPGTHTKAQLIKLQQAVVVPKMIALAQFIVDAARWGKLPCQPMLRQSASCSDITVERAFPASGGMLHQLWQNRVLRSDQPLCNEPVLTCGIENITEQEQLNRASTLLHALLSFGRQIDVGNYPTIADGKELVHLSPLHRLFRHTQKVPQATLTPSPSRRASNIAAAFQDTASAAANTGTPAADLSPRAVREAAVAGQPDLSGARLHYHENSRHVIVTHKTHFYELEVIEPSGRLLESSEIKRRIASIVEDGESVPPRCAFDFTKLAGMGREDFSNYRQRIMNECLSNRQCIESLESAICFLNLSVDGSETAEDVTLAQQAEGLAWWPGNLLSLHVYPNGNGVLKCSALVCDGPIMIQMAELIANDANCDPMLEYVAAPPKVIEAMTLQKRAPTPVVAGKKAPKAAKQVEDETYLAPVSITLPGPEGAKAPRRLPLWMPADNVKSFVCPPLTPPTQVFHFDLQLKKEATLYVAVLFALKHLNPARYPLVHLLRHAAVRDPTLQLIISNEAEAALRHVTSFTQSCGPLRTEVERSCAFAVDSVEALLSDGTPHVSNFAHLLEQGLLQQSHHKRDVLDGHLLGRPDIHISRLPHHGSNLLWACRSPVWADPSGNPAQQAPGMLSYSIVPAGRSSLRTTLGDLCHCALTVLPNDSLLGDVVVAEQFVQNIQMFAKFIDSCLRHVHRRP